MFRNIEMGAPSQQLKYRVRHMSLNNDDHNYEILDSNELYQITNSDVCSVHLVRGPQKKNETFTKSFSNIPSYWLPSFHIPVLVWVLIFYNLSQNHVFFAQHTTTILLPSMNQRSISVAARFLIDI